MALLTVTSISTVGAVTNLAAVNTTDTISASDVGDRGLLLEVANGAGAPMTVTISDAGTTPAGNAGTPLVVTITNATRKRIFIGPKNVNPATGVVTLTYSSATTITAEAFRY